MPKHLSADDVRGYSRLAIDATQQMTSLVEAMHHNISRPALLFGRTEGGKTGGITGLVYDSVRTIAGLVGQGLDGLLALAGPIAESALNAQGSSIQREALISLFNGVVGDHLEASGNPLAIRMSLRHRARALTLRRDPLMAQFPQANGRIVVLLHGLCMSDVWWLRNGHDHGAALARDLDATPLYLNYNSGRHISTNGRELAALLETLVTEWPVPVEDIVVVGFSQGGLVARSALHYAAQAGSQWPSRVRDLVLLGTPHHGAPLERHGNWLQWTAGVTPYTAPLARLGMLRSAGVTDLRHGNLLDEDWQDCDRFEHHDDRRSLVPLPAQVRCYAMAATTGEHVGDLKDRLLGDGIVPVDSALGRHAEAQRDLGLPDERRWLGTAMNHLDLLDAPEVYAAMRGWLVAARGGEVTASTAGEATAAGDNETAGEDKA